MNKWRLFEYKKNDFGLGVNRQCKELKKIANRKKIKQKLQKIRTLII